MGLDNPFKYGGVVRGPYFADRRAEIKELKREMINLNQIFLVSPRRFGKTCLLLNLIETLKRNAIACAYIDLLWQVSQPRPWKRIKTNFLKCFPDFKSFDQKYLWIRTE